MFNTTEIIVSIDRFRRFGASETPEMYFKLLWLKFNPSMDK